MEPKSLTKLVRKIEREAPGEIRACYGAGVCGLRDTLRLSQNSLLQLNNVVSTILGQPQVGCGCAFGDATGAERSARRALDHSRWVGIYVHRG